MSYKHLPIGNSGIPNSTVVSVPQLRAQNQVLKKGVVDEQANSASLKVHEQRALIELVGICLYSILLFKECDAANQCLSLIRAAGSHTDFTCIYIRSTS